MKIQRNKSKHTWKVSISYTELFIWLLVASALLLITCNVVCYDYASKKNSNAATSEFSTQH